MKRLKNKKYYKRKDQYGRRISCNRTVSKWV